MRDVRLTDAGFPLDEQGVVATRRPHVVEHVLGPRQLFLAPHQRIQLGRRGWRRRSTESTVRVPVGVTGARRMDA